MPKMGKKRPRFGLLLAAISPTVSTCFSTRGTFYASMISSPRNKASCSAVPRQRLPVSVLQQTQPSSSPLLALTDKCEYADDEYGTYDYAITDSTDLPSKLRPTPIKAISNPRDLLAVLLLSCGIAVSYCNITGHYGDAYQQWEQLSVLLGFASLTAALIQLRTGYEISPRPRRGVIDDSCMNLYAGLYSGCVSWLALRASEFCPLWLAQLDGVVPWLASLVFAFSLAAPIITLGENARSGATGTDGADNSPDTSISGTITKLARRSTGLSASAADQIRIPHALSNTELFRSKGLLAIGVLGCVFLPDCIAFAIGSSSWWDRVTAVHPSQRILESSTALFALYSTEASMVATRAANKGVAEYRVMVPVFAGVCLVLAIIPCACSLYWLGDDVSFFSFYRE